MTDSEQERARGIFVDAIDRTGDERRAFLESACAGDPGLRDRVERLLQAHDADVSGLGSTRDTLPDRPDLAETKFGRFRMLQKIGEGGFGEVWMAEQTEPVRRRVAIKIIKPGMDSAQVIARFDAERQALALMEHPNIARIYDGGQTDDGRPYFVMELVRGLPIIEYCSAKKLDLADRLDLFRQVCSGVQHAHQKGIIHRDIKPNNVLVGEVDGKPVPKVIDFGIAKALERPLTDKTLFTEFRQFVGTPEYMSPEQADLSLIDVDTRSDVYALGVMLYELLAGSPPFDPKSLRSAGFDEMRRIIIEEEPPPPSVRLSQSSEAVGIEEHERTFDRLGRSVRGELDWIVQRAMAKERDQRYSTANELEEDVARYVRGDGVEAGPPARIYRLKRYARRHRVAVVSLLSAFAGLSLIAVILGIGLYVIMDKNAELQVARWSQSFLNEELATNVDQLTVANAMIENRARAFNLAQVAGLAVDGQMQARAELPPEGGNWLAKMLRSTLPDLIDRSDESQQSEYAAIIGDGDLFEISQDGTRALVLNVGEDLVHLDLLRLDAGVDGALVAHLCSAKRSSAGALVYSGMFTTLIGATGSRMKPAGFSADGSRVVLSPMLKNLLQINAFGFESIQTDDFDWSTRVFSARTGDLLLSVPHEITGRAASVPAPQQYGMVTVTMNWACNADGSRLACLNGGRLEVHDVDGGALLCSRDLELPRRALPLLAMSEDGGAVAALSRDGSGWKSHPLSIVQLTDSDEESSGCVVRSLASGHAGVLVDSLAFTGADRLLMLDRANRLRSLSLLDFEEDDPIELGAVRPGPNRKLLQTPHGASTLVLNGRQLIEVELDQRLVRGRMFLGLAGSTPVWSPGSVKPQELMLWTASKKQRLRLGSPVATVISGLHGWAPSLLVEREVAPPASPVLEDLPIEQRPMTFVRKDDAPSDTRLFVPSGEVEIEGTVESVSPDGRFVITTVDDDDRTSVMITDLHGKASHEMDFQGTLGSPNGLVVRSHCWARVDDVPVYVAVVLNTSKRPAYYAINTWSALDGSLISSSPISMAFDNGLQSITPLDAMPAGEVEGPSSEKPRPMYSANSFATSADGRFVAVSGILMPFSEESERERFLLLNDKPSSALGVVVLYERSTGEMVDAFVQEQPIGPLALSNDGAWVAALRASGGDGLGTASVCILPNRSLDAGDDPLAHVVKSVALPGSYLMPSELLLGMSRSMHGETLSFSADGRLVSVALDQVVHLIDVPGRMLVDSLDWARIATLIELEGEPSEYVRRALRTGEYGFESVRFEGAAFSRDGSELRIDVLDGDIAMVRIRNTAWN